MAFLKILNNSGILKRGCVMKEKIDKTDERKIK